MRKRILIALLSITVAGILLLALLFTDVFYQNNVDAAERQLQIYMNFFDASAPFTQEEAESFSQKTDGARVTLMEADGTVVADSYAPVQGETREDREEVREAIENGEGYSVRESGTVGENMIYYCVRIDGQGGALVRIGMRLDTGVSFFVDALPTVIWFLVLDILCCLVFAWLATSAILKPVENLTKELASSASGSEIRTKYSELKPIAKMMNDMSADIGDKVARIKEDNRIEKLVLDSMEHGIAIFRSPSDVILINKTAARLLSYEENEPIPLFTEDAEISDLLSAGESASVYRTFGEKDYNFRFTMGDPNVLLITDVTESMAAARSKNEFIANVTHEMNTPLTSIKGFAELIAAGAVPPERIQGMAKTIIKQSDRLANLIRSIINFSAIDSDELPDYEVDISELIAELIGGFEPKLRKKNIALRLNVEQGVKVMSRRERLVEILNNLITNGIRYNKEGGTLEISLSGGDRPRLTVQDTGIGLSEEDKTRIFDRFYTVDKSHNGSGGGFGLGLAIVKKLCRRAGWELKVESTLGEGTAFTVVFCPKNEN
ncbi:MAG TPA: hypothetical protein H9727_00450 [Candidatus Borkfalkia avistercoris]|uniref:histidine kinase n=1 Tax=Candidatus Borkfalkia avistercoris TaxID=2838504 RepID=A0A9D2CXM2_9FIRM|nr:hypothetical protein [Candidatus Borkfalkia avistercoris]